MRNSLVKVIDFKNEKIINYTKDSKEYINLMEEYKKMKQELLEIPLVIGGERIYTDKTKDIIIPHEKKE